MTCVRCGDFARVLDCLSRCDGCVCDPDDDIAIGADGSVPWEDLFDAAEPWEDAL